MAEGRLRRRKADRGEGDFADKGGGELVERGFVDGAPGFEDLGFAEVGFGVGAVIPAVGQHQFVRQAVEGVAGDAQMMGFYSVVFDAEDGGRGGAFAGPGGVVGSFGRDERVTDGAAIIGPAGGVAAIVEIVVEAAIDMVLIVIRIARIEAFLFFIRRGAVVVGARLLHRVLVFIQDVGDPAVFIVESEPKRINAIGKILNTGHAGAIVVRHVALKCGFPAIATPVEAADQSATMVANHVQLVAERTGTRCVPSGDDAEIIIECHGHYRFRRVRTNTAPHCHVIEAQLEIESRMHFEEQEQLRAMDQRTAHIAIIQRFIVAKRTVHPEHLMRKRHRHRIEGDQIARHCPRISAPNDMSTRGRHRAQRRHPYAQEVDIHLLHPRIEP